MPLKVLRERQKNVFLAFFFTFFFWRAGFYGLQFFLFQDVSFPSHIREEYFVPSFPPVISVSNSFKFPRSRHQLWLNFNQGSLKKVRHSNTPKTSNLSWQGGKSYLQNLIDEESPYRTDGFDLSEFPLVANWE